MLCTLHVVCCRSAGDESTGETDVARRRRERREAREQRLRYKRRKSFTQTYKTDQWRIQDFQEGGCQLRGEGGALIYYLA